MGNRRHLESNPNKQKLNKEKLYLKVVWNELVTSVFNWFRDKLAMIKRENYLTREIKRLADENQVLVQQAKTKQLIEQQM